ncbi:MAG TPA: RNA polymerase sigma factor [Longimicrobiales bacterium]|nr:RNA polymerase sigma factor [Longimicrobiales bacterium]
MSQFPLSEALVRKARAGSPAALATLYRRHGGAMLAVAHRLTGSVTAAARVVQDVFVGLPPALRTYDGKTPFDAWLRRITVRVAIIRMRQQSDGRPRRLRPVSAGAHRIPEVPSEIAGADGILSTVQPDPIAFDQFVAELPDLPRMVFVLRGIEGYPHEEVANLLGISQKQSRHQFHQARIILAESIFSRS